MAAEAAVTVAANVAAKATVTVAAQMAAKAAVWQQRRWQRPLSGSRGGGRGR